MRVSSPAKINLFLHVTGRRADGYHELSTLMACLSLCDELIFDFDTTHIRVVCTHPDVPEDETNLAHRAASLFMERLSGLRRDVRRFGTGGVTITIDKQIPVGGGLGGGSSNAATVLKTLNQRFDSPFSRDELMEMGLTLGADVPFFVLGGAALAHGVGERLIPCSLDRSGRVLLALPGVFASTEQVYKNINLALTTGVKSNNNALIIACEEGRVLDCVDCMENDLEASACELYPEIKAFKIEVANLLDEKVMMTGSGSSFFAFFKDDEKAANALAILEQRWQHDERKNVCLTSFL